MNLKSILFHSIMGGFIAFASVLANADEKSAQEKYESRDYSEAGIGNAESAAQIYAELAQSSTVTTEKHRLLVKQSEALYFINDAKSYILRLKWRSQGEDAEDISGAKGADKAIRDAVIAGHDHGMNVARDVLKHYGVEDLMVEDDLEIPGNLQSLPALEKGILAQAAYFEGINLAGKALATGKMEFLPKWKTLKSKMFLILALGQESFSAYGAYRVLGRGYHKIPALFGGSMEKAEAYLRKSYDLGMVTSQRTALSGVTTFYLTDLLLALGKSTEAEDIAIALTQADVSALDSSLKLENKRAQKEVEHLFE